MITFIGDISSKYGRNKGDKDLKQRVRRNSLIAAGVGTAAGLGIGGYLALKSRQPLKGKIVMPNVPDNPISHLNSKKSVEGALKKYEEEFDVAAQIHKNVKANTETKSFKNTGGWLLRNPRANRKIKSQKRLLNPEKANVRGNIKSEAEAIKWGTKYGDRVPTIKIAQGKKKFKFKTQ
jgi:hypothetical protein